MAFAKSAYDLRLFTIDGELGKHYYVSEKLSFRPFVGLKNGWIDQHQRIRYTGGSLGRNSAHIDDDCDYWGLGARGGLNSIWNFGEGWAFNGGFSAALLYGFFDIEHREKLTPNPMDRLKLEDNKHRFSPMAQWRLGLSYGQYCWQKEIYLECGLYYEGMYWWRQNQMLKIYEYNAIRYDNYAEDISMHGITFSGRIYF